MKSPDLSRGAFAASPMLDTKMQTAHSGPELVRSIPQSGLARELAQTLLTDHVQLTQAQTHPHIGSAYSGGMMIGLARR